MTENEAKIMEAREILVDLSKDDKRIYAEEYEALNKAIFALEEIRQYRAIGTIEEFKALKEKSVAKKPTPIDYEKYMDVVTNAKFLRGACWCPNCKHTVLSGVYCGNCGQKLDWSE